MTARRNLRPLALVFASAALSACADGRDPVAPVPAVSPSLFVMCPSRMYRPDLIVTSFSKSALESWDAAGNVTVLVTATIKNQGACPAGKFPLEVLVDIYDGAEYVTPFLADENATTGSDGWTKAGLAAGASVTVTGKVKLSQQIIGSHLAAELYLLGDSCWFISSLAASTCAVTESNEANNKSGNVTLWLDTSGS
jgi:hypothetical protein